MVGHGLITSGLFMVCGLVYLRCKTRDINELGGIASYCPRLFSFATIIVLASIGLPLFAGFIGEILTIIGAVVSEITDLMKLIAILALPMLILSSCYMLKFLHSGFWGKAEKCKPAYDILSHEFVVLGIDYLEPLQIYWPFLLAGLLFSTTLPYKLLERFKKNKVIVVVILAAILGGSIYCMYMGYDDPFLYFRF